MFFTFCDIYYYIIVIDWIPREDGRIVYSDLDIETSGYFSRYLSIYKFRSETPNII